MRYLPENIADLALSEARLQGVSSSRIEGFLDRSNKSLFHHVDQLMTWHRTNQWEDFWVDVYDVSINAKQDWDKIYRAYPGLVQTIDLSLLSDIII